MKPDQENAKRILDALAHFWIIKSEIEYLPDEHVDKLLDREIRDLLTTCFTKPQDVVFKTQRYFREPYPRRWIIRGKNGALVAHIGVHEKQIEGNGSTFRIGGICEVCVHPDYRGRGYVKLMLKCIHAWLSGHGFAFAVLFGDHRVYGSSGYVRIDNLVHGGDGDGWKPVKAMVREMSDTPWPGGEVRLPSRHSLTPAYPHRRGTAIFITTAQRSPERRN